MINFSGGANGSDSKWDEIGRKHGVTDHVHFYHGRITPLGNRELTDEELEEGWIHVLKANETLCRYPYKYKDLLSRNWFQVKNGDVVYAIIESIVSNIKSQSIVTGGTGWAVQMAIDSGKDVYVYDQSEKQWKCSLKGSKTFACCETPTLTEKFAGIGTRAINEYGIKAIEDVYEKTFKK